jgi:hypothetical protein
MASSVKLQQLETELLAACRLFDSNKLSFTDLLMAITAYRKQYDQENAVHHL